ncbi:MAG: RNA-binding S4 domain-containing protein [Pseudomonadota bacterium]|nr:RNA-binding S4 domain-containing protein [Pseudomonadota bacterium]
METPAHPPEHPPETLTLRGDHIALDALLKCCGVATSGGDAKQLIASAAVQVNGETELRRGRKLRHGDRVDIGGKRIGVTADHTPPPSSALGI